MSSASRAGDAAPFPLTPLEPFGAEVALDLTRPLSADEQGAFRELFYREKLLVFRGQALSEDDQVRVMSYIGGVLGSRGEYREISSDGNLGGGPLCFHSDLSFTPEPFKALSLQALEVNDDETWTAFASGVRVLDALPADLRRQVERLEALAVISATQSHRAAPYDPASFLPQVMRPAVIEHPVTGEPILYVTEMQTARLNGLAQPESDALLQSLFDHLYAPANVYRHAWRKGDLVIWDNIALQHARPDLTGVKPRRLQRIAVADKSFFDLCPQFSLDDPRIAAWGAGETLDV
jgi:taurine dioxygenase